jgi:hypothetical protein
MAANERTMYPSHQIKYHYEYENHVPIFYSLMNFWLGVFLLPMLHVTFPIAPQTENKPKRETFIIVESFWEQIKNRQLI